MDKVPQRGQLQSLAPPLLASAPPTPVRAAATNSSPLQHVSGGGGRGLGCGATKAHVEVAKAKTPSGSFVNDDVAPSRAGGPPGSPC